MFKSIIGLVMKNHITMAVATFFGLVIAGSAGAAIYLTQNSQQSPASVVSTKTPSVVTTTASSASTSVPTTSQSAAFSPTTTKSAVSTAKTVNASAIVLKSKSTGYCKALAPSDWSFTANAQATGADLFSPGQTMHAGWGISAVPSYMYPTAESFLNTWMPLAGYSGFTMEDSKNLDHDFVQRDFTSTSGKKGVIIYKVYNFGTTDYVVSVYIAATNNNLWDAQGAQAFYSAISIRCVSQLRPATLSVNYQSSNPSNSSDNPEVSLSDKWTEAIMGYENVYSPTTGEHYEAPLNSYWAGGPSGGGYYRDLPNGGYEKLEAGFGNY